MTEIRAAQFPEHVELVRTIFREYADSLGIDLDFQDFDAELASLPANMRHPKATFFLRGATARWSAG